MYRQYRDAMVYLHGFLIHFVESPVRPRFSLAEYKQWLKQLITEIENEAISDNLLKNQATVLQLHDMLSANSDDAIQHMAQFMDTMLDWQNYISEAIKHNDFGIASQYLLTASGNTNSGNKMTISDDTIAMQIEVPLDKFDPQTFEELVKRLLGVYADAAINAEVVKMDSQLA